MIEGFNGDSFILEEIRRLIDRFRIQALVETGTHYGATARLLAETWPALPLLTIEVEPAYYAAASHLDVLPNVRRALGSSPCVLDRLLPELPRPVLCYLDAHWGDPHPLRAELRAIGRHAPNSILVIHDFRVSGREDLGYDLAAPIGRDGPPLDEPYIADLLPGVYPAGWMLRYNKVAEGARRGVAYLEPAAIISK